MEKIIQQDDPRLRQNARLVPAKLIGGAELTQLIREMSAALAAEPDGVALAAPQLGVHWRLFIVSGKLLAAAGEKTAKDLVFINPEIIKRSRRKVWLQEGCLSVRWRYGETHRAERTSIRALDESGRPLTRHASGLLAQIFQHEVDHLDGKLFIDEAKNLVTVPPPVVQPKP